MALQPTSSPRSRNGKLRSAPPGASTLEVPALEAPLTPPVRAKVPEAAPMATGQASVWSASGDVVRLNFVNRSNDANNSSVVIFAKNVAASSGETAIAWQVIRNCGQGWSHPFVYPMAVTVGVSDSYGNFSPQMAAQNGEMYQVTQTSSGDTLSYGGPATSPTEVQILNNLSQGAINAVVFRAGKPYAVQTSVAPQQKAVFTFTPTLWIGVVSEVVEGQAMNSAIVSSVNTEISLLGIASADIVLTGGGPGAHSTPFMFTLQNVVMA